MDGMKAFAGELAVLVAAELAERRPAKRVFTLQEAAEYCGCSEDKLRDLAAGNTLRAVRYDRYLRFDVKDLDLFIDRSKR